MKEKKQRFWEVDVLRGIAIIMMVSYHIYIDAYFLDLIEIPYFSAPYIGGLFLFLVGVSLTLSYNRVKDQFTQKQLILKYVRRGLFIFSIGLLITVVTWFVIGRGFIVFGVLHCIGLSIVFAYPFLRENYLPLILGLLLVPIGLLLRFFSWDFPWLVWLGFIPKGFFTYDYFPLLPWFGVILIGISIGNLIYTDGVRQFPLPDLSSFFVFRGLGFLGKHALLIYVVHQPVILIVYVLISINGLVL